MPTKLQRQEIQGVFVDLELAIAQPHVQEEMLQRIAEVKEQLGRYEFARDSSYYTRLAEIELKVRNPLPRPDDECRREYVGMCDRQKLRVRCTFDALFISRVYGGKLKMGWRFNVEGRLDLADAVVLPAREVFPCFSVVNYKSIPAAWQRQEVHLHDIVRETDLLNASFRSLTDAYKYQSIARFGHGAARAIWTALDNATVFDADRVLDHQRNLRDIIHDTKACSIIGKAATLLPSMNYMNNKAWIEYANRT